MQKRFRIVAPVLAALVVLLAGSAILVRADSHDDVFYACLFAGSLSQVNNTAPPANCGRGVNVSWEGTDEVGIDPTDLYWVESLPFNYAANLPATTQHFGEALCEEGDYVISGGYELHAQNDPSTPRFFRAVSKDGPNAAEDGWEVLLGEPGAAAGSLIVYAHCLSLP